MRRSTRRPGVLDDTGIDNGRNSDTVIWFVTCGTTRELALRELALGELALGELALRELAHRELALCKSGSCGLKLAGGERPAKRRGNGSH